MSRKKSINSRRDFIRNSAVALGGFYIVPRQVLGGKGFTAPSDKLQIAGIGAGGKGESDLDYFFKTGKVDIPFLCDVDERSYAWRTRNGCHAIAQACVCAKTNGTRYLRSKNDDQGSTRL